MTIQEQREADQIRLMGGCEANLAYYVYDEYGSCRGRCVAHETGGPHHPLCPEAAREVAS